MPWTRGEALRRLRWGILSYAAGAFLAADVARTQVQTLMTGDLLARILFMFRFGGMLFLIGFGLAATTSSAGLLFREKARWGGLALVIGGFAGIFWIFSLDAERASLAVIPFCFIFLGIFLIGAGLRMPGVFRPLE